MTCSLLPGHMLRDDAPLIAAEAARRLAAQMGAVDEADWAHGAAIALRREGADDRGASRRGFEHTDQPLPHICTDTQTHRQHTHTFEPLPQTSRYVGSR